MTSSVIREFSYKLAGTSAERRPGAHQSRQSGPGMRFSSYARLFDAPDPRRLDLRASLRDVRGDWLVRSYQQPASLTIYTVVDISPSMRFGKPGKLRIAADFLHSLAQSASRYGDAVCLLPFDLVYRHDLFIPPQRHRALGESLVTHLLQSTVSEITEKQQTDKLRALVDTVKHVPHRNSLVFIVSDFHGPLEPLAEALKSLSASTVIPMVLWDRAEIEPPPANRFLQARELVSTERLSVWLTEKKRREWLAKVEQRRDKLKTMFQRYHCAPMFIDRAFDADAMTRHFFERVA
ncbi:MAG: DUF58 domain-containing protein [Granulosicoccus sp.]